MKIRRDERATRGLGGQGKARTTTSIERVARFRVFSLCQGRALNRARLTLCPTKKPTPNPRPALPRPYVGLTLKCGGDTAWLSLNQLDVSSTQWQVDLMTPGEALKAIRGLAGANRIRVSAHAYERMKERGAGYKDVHHALVNARGVRGRHRSRRGRLRAPISTVTP